MKNVSEILIFMRPKYLGVEKLLCLSEKFSARIIIKYPLVFTPFHPYLVRMDLYQGWIQDFPDKRIAKRTIKSFR